MKTAIKVMLTGNREIILPIVIVGKVTGNSIAEAVLDSMIERYPMDVESIAGLSKV